jgi:hypothetical protein
MPKKMCAKPTRSTQRIYRQKPYQHAHARATGSVVRSKKEDEQKRSYPARVTSWSRRRGASRLRRAQHAPLPCASKWATYTDWRVGLPKCQRPQIAASPGRRYRSTARVPTHTTSEPARIVDPKVPGPGNPYPEGKTSHLPRAALGSLFKPEPRTSSPPISIDLAAGVISETRRLEKSHAATRAKSRSHCLPGPGNGIQNANRWGRRPREVTTSHREENPSTTAAI